MFCMGLILSGDILRILKDYDKSLFFYDQCRKICDWVSPLTELKPLIYQKIGEIAISIRQIEAALKIFKKGL